MSLALNGSIDANIILRWMLNDVPEQYKKSARLIEGSKFLHVSSLVVAEVVFILEGKGFERSEIIANIQGFMAQPNILCLRATLMPALELYEQRRSLSFIDCCLGFDAEVEYALPLYTFDKKLANQSGGRAKLLK